MVFYIKCRDRENREVVISTSELRRQGYLVEAYPNAPETEPEGIVVKTCIRCSKYVNLIEDKYIEGRVKNGKPVKKSGWKLLIAHMRTMPEYQNLRVTDISKIASQFWKDPSVKAEWNKEANRIYKELMDKWNAEWDKRWNEVVQELRGAERLTFLQK